MSKGMVLLELPETVGVAFEVLTNAYGTGTERVNKLKEAGYDASKVQQCVNELVDMFERYS